MTANLLERISSPGLLFSLLLLTLHMLRAYSALAFRAVPFLTKNRCNASKNSATVTTTIRWLTTKTDEETRIYEELKWLSSEIIRNDHLYYNEQPVLEDEEFDALVRRENEIKTQFPKLVKKLQKESGLGIQATRDGRVGSPFSVVERKKRKHLRPMLSLDNAHDEPQLLAWLTRVSKATVEVLSETNATVQILTEPKLDGVSLSLRYEIEKMKEGSQSYELSWASTRGDGRVGQDVTDAVSSIPNIPKSLSAIGGNSDKNGDELASTVEIRGEVVFPKTEFQSLSPDIYTFSNTRNAAAGILNRKPSEDPEEAEEAKKLQSQLQFYAYDVVADKDAFSNGIVNRARMHEWGFLVPEPAIVTDLEYIQNSTQEEFSEQMNIDSMLEYYDSLRRHRLDLGPDSSKNPKYDWRDFDMDGCVHKVVNPDIKQEMGRSMKSPNWAVAHKYPAVSAVTDLIDVIVQVGRTGVLTPVALLKPVVVGGVTISRATLHNFDHLQELLGNITSIPVNTSVLVRRAGDVIPQVVSRVGDASKNENQGNDDDWISLETPKKCPACGSDVVWGATNGTAAPVVRCSGPPMLCRPQAISSLAHAYSRNALDVTGLSDSRIQQLMEADLLQYPADVFKYKEEEWKKLQEMPGWGPKSVQNLQTVTRKVAARGIPLRRFLYSLGIRHMGKHSSELVASTFGTKEDFLKAMDAGLTWEKPTLGEEGEEGDSDVEHPFSKLNGQLGIGESVMSSLVAFAKNKDLAEAAKQLASAIKIIDEVKEPTATTRAGGKDVSKPWKGMRVVFTGAIPDFSRSAANSVAKSLGAKATPGSVSKSTDLVVYGNKGGKKLKQAIQYGVDTMTAEEFIKLVKENEIMD